MRPLIFRFGLVILFGVLLLILLNTSVVLTNADNLETQNSGTTLSIPSVAKGAGLWEAECATLAGSWTKQDASRGSKQSCDTAHSYIESASKTAQVCLNFKNADRVGIGYVAGNQKGKANAIARDSNGQTLGHLNWNTYDNYSDSNFPPTAQASDRVDSSTAKASLTFHAFRWVWEQDPTQADKKGSICVNPKGAVGTTGGSATVSIDYFVVANGDPMGLRGLARTSDAMTMAETHAEWNYNACVETPTNPIGCEQLTSMKLPEGFMPANGSDAWEGYIPKIADPSNWAQAGNSYADPGETFKTNYVYPIIQGARAYATGKGLPQDTFVPKYWILFNEPDLAIHFYPDWVQLPPDAPEYTHGLANLTQEILDGYDDQNVAVNSSDVVPEIIVETGSQVHAYPSGGEWGANGCGANWLDPNNDPYWGCTHDSDVWIADFWDALKTDMQANPGDYPLTYNEVKAAIGGFGGHYFQTNDPSCQTSACTLDTSDSSRILQFVSNLRIWMSAEFSDREVWLVATGTGIGPNDFCTNVSTSLLRLANQVDGFACKRNNKPVLKLDVRNYMGKLEQALGSHGVNRWAWFAERNGPHNECNPGKNDGEATALNASCSGYTASPFGHNFTLAAPYR